VDLSLRHLLAVFLQFGAFGILLLSIADDSFLFLPIGSDLLTVILVARHPQQLPVYVLAGAVGSMIGVFFLDLVCRKGGEAGLQRLVKPRLRDYLKQQIERHAAVAIIITCVAPPPFPFGAAIAVASAFQYPRLRLLALVLVARAVRFSLIGWAALHFGRRILRIANSTEFMWIMGGFIAFCLVGSIVSVIHWIRIGRSMSVNERESRAPQSAPAPSRYTGRDNR
jgi:membrane protein YqaA with SNARE-associated domain